MIQYLIILLDKTATSYCHYENPEKEPGLMPLDTLREGIRFAMKENLNVQFVYPSYELPTDYQKVIESIDHSKIKPAVSADDKADVVVFNSYEEMKNFSFQPEVAYVLRLSKSVLFEHYEALAACFSKMSRLNIVLTDVDSFTEEDFQTYKSVLDAWVEKLEQLYVSGCTSQLNLLTDRLLLDKMNNCGAGDSNITLAPDGRFYVCPAFYLMEDGYSVGNLKEGLDIKNPQLYRLDHAPLCRHCDAYQCKRCIWLNRKTTLEVNTPSHEQCLVAHLERNASRELLNRIKSHGLQMAGNQEIAEIDYLDPFEVRKQW